jgi:hypothetical protein
MAAWASLMAARIQPDAGSAHDAKDFDSAESSHDGVMPVSGLCEEKVSFLMRGRTSLESRM